VRAARILFLTLVSVLALAAKPSSAAPITFDLVQGELTAVTVGTSSNLLAAPVALSDATLTADFDPAVLDLNNLFISADGPGSISLLGLGSVVFTNASLQSIGTTDLTVGGPALFNFGTPAIVSSDLAIVVGGSTIPLGSQSGLSGVAGSILLAPSELDITVTGVVLGALPGPRGDLIKADLHFSARNLGGQTAIPEPGSELLFPAGLLLLGWALRTRRAESC
jgi:hypothetical protein